MPYNIIIYTVLFLFIKILSNQISVQYFYKFILIFIQIIEGQEARALGLMSLHDDGGQP